MSILRKINEWSNIIHVSDITNNCRGYQTVRIESWYYGSQVIYYEGELYMFRHSVSWKYKKKLYKQRVYLVSAKNNTLIIQIWKENEKLYKLLNENSKKELNKMRLIIDFEKLYYLVEDYLDTDELVQLKNIDSDFIIDYDIENDEIVINKVKFEKNNNKDFAKRIINLIDDRMEDLIIENEEFEKSYYEENEFEYMRGN